MIREPYNLNPYNSTIDTSKVNNFSFTFSGDELGSWNIEIAKNNTSPEIVYTSEEFVPEDVGYTHIYDGDIVEGITLPSTIAHSQGDDGLLRRLYSINGYPFNAAVVKLNVNGIENIGNIKGSTANGYLVATNYSLGRTGSNVTIIGFDRDGTTIGSQVTDGTYDFLGYLLSVKENSNIEVGQVVQIGGNSFVIGNIEDAGDGYSELTIVNGEVTSSDVTPILTFDSLAEADVTELTVGIEPVQDLNGYDKPWVGGAGKNLYDGSLIRFNADPSATSLNGITLTKNADGSFRVRGTASAETRLNVNYTNSFAVASYAISVRGITGSGLRIILQGNPSSAGIAYTSVYPTSDWSQVYSVTESSTLNYFFLDVQNGATIDFTLKVQIEKGSTATAWQPYSNICPITGHDEVRVTRTGKNLLNLNVTSKTQNGITFTVNADGSIKVNGTATSGNAYFTKTTGAPPKMTKGTTVTLSGVEGSTTNQLYLQLIYIGADGSTISITSVSGATTYTFAQDATFSAYWLTARQGATHDNTMVYPQLELGSTATAYEPYQGSTYTASLGQTVYGGTLDMVTGVLTVDRRYLTVDDFSDFNGGVSGGGLHWVNVPKSRPVGVNDDTSTNVCSHAPYSSNNGTGWASRTPMYSVNSGGFPARIYVASASLADFRTEYATLQAVYKLAEPVEYQLTPQQIKTLVGTNNVWASSGDIVSIKFTYETN